MPIPLQPTKRNPLNRRVSAILSSVFVLSLCHAQTVRPVISEYPAKVAKGTFELVNPGVVPLNVILNPMSFSVSKTGDVTYRPLDKNIRLKLSAMSFQIAPEQSYFVFYEARADVLPAWFVIYSNIGAVRKEKTGMNMRVDLPHTIYILTKRSVEKSEILISSLGPTPDKAHFGFQVTNTGAWFGRVLSSELVGKERPTPGIGFPLFPQSSRIVEVPCKGDQATSTLRLRLRNFEMEEPLSDLKGSMACDP